MSAKVEQVADSEWFSECCDATHGIGGVHVVAKAVGRDERHHQRHGCHQAFHACSL